MNAAEIVDKAATDRVLVFGSLPPHGRDLDLLVRPEQRGQVERGLADEGFINKGPAWVRFENCTVDAVEVIPAGDWDLDDPRVEALFARAIPLEGFTHLVRPAPDAALVILARRMMRSGGELDAKKRGRVRLALEEDRVAWAHAQRLGREWDSYRAVIALERLYKSGVATSARKRATAVAERHRGAGRSAPLLRAWRTVLKKEPGRGVVTFSGLDGSGKTSQAESLRDSLERTTGDAVVVWTRLSYNPSLKAIARPIKALLRGRAGNNPSEAASAATDRGKELRRKSPVVTQAWATAVALANAAAQRRVTRYHLRRGRTVVCDRYTLDSRVHLRYRYGEDRRFSLQARLIQAISPQPVKSYLIEVSPEVALDRKAEQYDLEQLRSQFRLYREESEALGVTRLDGTRPKEELCSEIAEEVWRSV